MSGSQRPLEPVAPDGMELLFFYRCPHCLRHVPLVNPVEPRNVRCDGCGKQFPIIPVDEHGLHYVRIMLANGCQSRLSVSIAIRPEGGPSGRFL